MRSSPGIDRESGALASALGNDQSPASGGMGPHLPTPQSDWQTDPGEIDIGGCLRPEIALSPRAAPDLNCEAEVARENSPTVWSSQEQKTSASPKGLSESIPSFSAQYEATSLPCLTAPTAPLEIASSNPDGVNLQSILAPAETNGGQVDNIVHDLLAQALGTVLPLPTIRFDSAPMGGGNTAETVGRVVLHTPFVFKVDRDAKLAKEAKIIREIRLNTDLPARFREAWPVIYAILDRSPDASAYLMEYFPPADGWASLEDRLFPGNQVETSSSEAVRLLESVLDILFLGYEASVDGRILPSIRKDYVERIRDRLDAAQRISPVFRPRALTLNGERYPAWNESLHQMENLGVQLEAFAPPFSTIVHGDPNLGNLLIRTNGPLVEVKLIDPKPWGRGDYIFDMTKITHFLTSTAPIEKTVSFSKQQIDPQVLEDTGALDYTVPRPPATDALVNACLKRAAQFADHHDDKHWQERYELGMAANLLGLPASRYAHPTMARPKAAIALYAEGLTWLTRFCNRLS